MTAITDIETCIPVWDAQLDDMLTRIGDAIRREVIVPFCDRHRLRYVQGMGTWLFEAPSGRVIYAEDCEQWEAFQRVEALLTWEPSGMRHPIGFSVCDYNGREPKTRRASKED